MPVLAGAMRQQKPFRHHEGHGKCVGLCFLKARSRLRGHRHPPQYAFVVETWAMSHEEVAELMGCGKPLNAHLAFGRDQDAWNWIGQICSEQTSQGPYQKLKPNGMDGAKHIDVSTVAIDHA